MPKTTFIDGSYSTGVVGSRITAALFNKLNSQRHTGRDIDGEGALDYAATGGSSNAYTLNLTPALDAYITGMPLYFKASFTNTGAATLNVNGLGTMALKKNLSDDLVAADIISGQLYVGMYDGTNIIVINVPRAAATKSNFPDNYGLAASVASNALTISRKGANGNDPSSGNVVTVPFRNPTLTLGYPLWVQYVVSASITLPQGSTLGFTAGESGRFYIYEGTDGTNTDMGVIRKAIVPEHAKFSSTAVSSSATSTTTLYSTSARSNWVWRCIGFIEATMGATVGNWASNEKIQIMGPGINKSGDIIQMVYTSKTDVSTISSSSFIDVSGWAVSMTPTSALNKVIVSASAFVGSNGGATSFLRLMRDSTIILQGDASSTRTRTLTAWNTSNSAYGMPLSMAAVDIPGGTSSVSYHAEAMAQSGYNITINSTYSDTDNIYYARAAAIITAMEVMS